MSDINSTSSSDQSDTAVRPPSIRDASSQFDSETQNPSSLSFELKDESAARGSKEQSHSELGDSSIASRSTAEQDTQGIQAGQLNQPASQPEPSWTAPFSNPFFRYIWIASLFSNLGSWVHDVGASWLMTSLDSSPAMVSGVRLMTALPIVFVALVAGAIADRFDRRRLLIGVQIAMASVAALLSVLTYLEIVNSWGLLALTLVMGFFAAINIPTWQSIMPELVPKHVVPAAVGLGSVSFNIARTIGPAVGGYLIAWQGPGLAFAINSVSFVGVVGVLLSWGRTANDSSTTRQLSIRRSIIEGLRFVANDSLLRNAMCIVVLFVFPATCFWSLLPLVVRVQLGLGPDGFGTMLGLFGAGAVLGAVVLPIGRRRFGSNGVIAFSMCCCAGCLAIIGFQMNPILQVIAMPTLGLCWMSILTTLQSTMQIRLPNEYRARGMASYLTLFALNMSVGASSWGVIATQFSLQTAFCLAAFMLLVTAFVSLTRNVGSLDLTAEE